MFTNQDIKVVVRGVKSSVSFCTERGAEDDEILCDRGMNDVHGTHGTAGVVEHPFFLVGVDGDFVGRLRVSLREVCDNMVDDGWHVVLRRSSNGVLRDRMQELRGEDIPPILG